MGLTNKQQIFVNEYLKCWNATEAARRAGYSNPNKRGPENVVKRGISEEIERRKNELLMTADEALMRLSAQARSSIGDFFTHYEGINVPFLNLQRADENGLMPLVHKVEFNDHGRVSKIELYNSQRALEDILKIHGKFVSKVEIDWRQALPDGYEANEVQRQFIEVMKQAKASKGDD